MRKILQLLSFSIFFLTQLAWSDVASQPVPATAEQLQQFVQSVDLSVWAGVSTYLWTCTPRYFVTPMFDAKNEMQNQFDQFKKDKKILTSDHATQIAGLVATPLSVKIPGLSGIMCRFNISVANVEKPYTLNCLFIILDARYLSRLLYDVAQNSGKPQLVPQETVDAIQKLFDANCTKQT